jgi:hypothetical protein
MKLSMNSCPTSAAQAEYPVRRMSNWPATMNTGMKIILMSGVEDLDISGTRGLGLVDRYGVYCDVLWQIRKCA